MTPTIATAAEALCRSAHPSSELPDRYIVNKIDLDALRLALATSAQPVATDEDVAKMFHDEYECAAARHGWQSQDSCKTPWATLPEANKRTVIDTVHAVRHALFAAPPAAVASVEREKFTEAAMAWCLAYFTKQYRNEGQVAEFAAMRNAYAVLTRLKRV